MERENLIEYVYDSLKAVLVVGKEEESKYLINQLLDKFIYVDETKQNPKTNEDALSLFVSSKSIEGCSNRTIQYYKTTILTMLKSVNKIYYLIQTEDLRLYLSKYREKYFQVECRKENAAKSHR